MRPARSRSGARRAGAYAAITERTSLSNSIDTSAASALRCRYERTGGARPWTALTASSETIEFEKARATYYDLAGCDPATGYPTKAKLATLGLEWTSA